MRFTIVQIIKILLDYILKEILLFYSSHQINGVYLNKIKYVGADFLLHDGLQNDVK